MTDCTWLQLFREASSTPAICLMCGFLSSFFFLFFFNRTGLCSYRFDHLPTQTWFFTLLSIIYIGLLQHTGQKAACRIYQLSSANWKEQWVSLEKDNWLSNANTSRPKEPVFDDIGNKIQQLILSPELLTHRQFQDTVKNYEQKRKSHERGITIRPLTSFGRTIHPAITVTTCVELLSLVTNWFNVCGETSQDLIANVNVLLWLKQHIYKKHWVWIVAASVVNALCGWMRCVNAKENTQTNPEPVACERQRERETSSWHL